MSDKLWPDVYDGEGITWKERAENAEAEIDRLKAENERIKNRFFRTDAIRSKCRKRQRVRICVCPVGILCSEA